MNATQWRAFRRVTGPHSVAGFLVDFGAQRARAVAGSSSTYGGGEWVETRRDGIHALVAGTTVRVHWEDVKSWAAEQPSSVVEAAREFGHEWGAICEKRYRFSQPGQMLPSWLECTVFGPLTEAAVNAVECDVWSDDFHRRESAWADSLAPSDEPTDLLELIAAAESVA